MTLLKKFKKDHPNASYIDNNPKCCPSHLGYINEGCTVGNCTKCWNREMHEDPNFKYTGKPIAKVVGIKENENGVTITTLPYKPQVKNEEPHILDSGDRTEFETGAVRDMREGKGRCDLLPLDVVAEIYAMYGDVDCDKISEILHCIDDFQQTNNLDKLRHAIFLFDQYKEWSTMFLEVAKHFEEGAKKYGDNNWRKGIPVRCYIDSAVRHYLKYLRGDKDEPHDRAFCWNILCCIWTCKHMPELNDYRKEDENG